MSVDASQLAPEATAEQPATTPPGVREAALVAGIPAAQDTTTQTLVTALGPLATAAAQTVAQQAVDEFVTPHKEALTTLQEQAAAVLAQLESQPAVKQLVDQAVGSLRADMVALQSSVLQSATVAAPQIATAVVRDVEGASSQEQRIVVIGVIATAMVLSVIILVAALGGNHLAQSWIAAAPASVVGAVLWISHTGIWTPKPRVLQAAEVPVAPVAVP